MLPDIIDKPLGTVILGDIFSNGRILTHSLAFSLLLAILGVYLYLRNSMTAALTLSYGSLVHLVFDEMWLDPQTFLWPLCGWSFARVDIDNWFPKMLHSLVSNPHVFMPEIVGFLIISQFIFGLVWGGRVSAFLKEGTAG